MVFNRMVSLTSSEGSVIPQQTDNYSRRTNLDSDLLQSSSPATVSPRDYVSFHTLPYLISRSCSTT